MTLLLLVACVGLTQVPEKQQGDTPADSGGGDTDTPVTAGALAVSKSSVDFGDVLIDSQESDPITLSNTGDETIRVAAAQSGSTRFSLDMTAVELEAGADQVLTVTFEPDMESSFEGAIELNVDSGDAATVTLSGAGVTEGGGTDTDTGSGSAEGDIEAAKTSMDFGDVDLLDTYSVSMAVSNEGTADLLVDNATTSDAAFTVVGDFATSRVLAPGTSKTLQVEFTPTSAKTYSGTLTLSSDDPDEPAYKITLTGKGVDECDICSPIIEVDTGGDPYSMEDFFSFLGSPDSKTVTVRNSGDEDLVVSDVSVSNDIFSPCGEFTLSGWSSSKTLGPGDVTSFVISYSVTDVCLDVANPGIDMNVAHIRSNDPGQPDYQISLGGSGLI